MILRPDADRVFGGDTVVMEKLSAALRSLGVEVVVGRQARCRPRPAFDLLHIFTIAPLDHAQRMVAWAQAGKASIVFSPLYYNDFRDWFERAIVNAPRWRTLARHSASAAAWQLYRAWQTARLPCSPCGGPCASALLAADAVATTSQWENAWVAEHFRLPQHVRDQMALSRFGIDAELLRPAILCRADLDAFRRKLRPGRTVHRRGGADRIEEEPACRHRGFVG